MNNPTKKDYAVIIMDMSGITGEQFRHLWQENYIRYAARIKPESIRKVTDAVDKIQDDEEPTLKD